MRGATTEAAAHSEAAEVTGVAAVATGIVAVGTAGAAV